MEGKKLGWVEGKKVGWVEGKKLGWVEGKKLGCKEGKKVEGVEIGERVGHSPPQSIQPNSYSPL